MFVAYKHAGIGRQGHEKVNTQLQQISQRSIRWAIELEQLVIVADRSETSYVWKQRWHPGSTFCQGICGSVVRR